MHHFSPSKECVLAKKKHRGDVVKAGSSQCCWDQLVGERLELCARQHYSKNYQYIKFIQCMDRNVSTIPIRAPECAQETGMDLDLLVACANMEVSSLLFCSFRYVVSSVTAFSAVFVWLLRASCLWIRPFKGNLQADVSKLSTRIHFRNMC